MTSESPSKKLHTEDDGKIFEMGICMCLEIPYDGSYKYVGPEDTAKADQISSRLKSGIFRDLLGDTFSHTAKRGARYDFTSTTEAKHLSAKTCKKGIGKIAPQVMGQCQPAKFCETMNIEFTDIITTKKWIQENTATVLSKMVEYTFDCPNIYYNVAADTILYITLASPIDWSSYEYEWTRDYETWANSSTVKIKKVGPIAEFQFHTKSRTNMANRWVYDNLWKFFPENFKVIVL